MAMPDLEELQNKWKVEEILNKHQIKSQIHYLIKWANWSFEYNFYEPAAHLAGASKTVAAYEKKVSRKHKHKTSADKNA